MTAIFKWVGVLFLSIGLVFLVMLWAIGSDGRALVFDPPSDKRVLFWSQTQRDAAFKMLDKLPFLVKSRTIEPSDTVKPLPKGKTLSLDDIDAFFEEQRLSGALVLHKGNIRYERYALGHAQDKRWTSFSVAKSFTSSLVGIALKEGHIENLNDSVSKYIKALKGSAYDQVSIEQLLTMTSGVEWNENYSDPNSDVAKFNEHKSQDGLPTIVSYLKSLKRVHPPGEQWHYSTGETNLIGILIENATGQNLSDYLSAKIWQPFGMESKATWLLSAEGNEISGCCIQATLRDYARMGLFISEGGKINGESLFPNGYLKAATTKQADIGQAGRGYGYQWWTFDDGSFTARGIFGQTLFIDPQRELVVALNGNWPIASDSKLNDKRFAYIDKIRAMIDDE